MKEHMFYSFDCNKLFVRFVIQKFADQLFVSIVTLCFPSGVVGPDLGK